LIGRHDLRDRNPHSQLSLIAGLLAFALLLIVGDRAPLVIGFDPASASPGALTLTLPDGPTVEFAARALLTLFVVIDPAGLVPVFVSLASGRPTRVQATIARRAVLIAGGVLLSFALVGGPLLAYLGISVFALRIAGGILLFRIGLDMVFALFRRETPEEEAEARIKPDISVFPLAIPLISGPGALATILILAADARGETGLFALVLGAAAVVLFVAYLVLRASGRIARLLGQTGTNVVTRVLGLILSALAVQYVVDGVVGLDLFR
jgi:multiple antibiotic resistance protein